jgi:hypothetical protein
MTAAAETAPGPQIHRRYPAATTIAMPCPIRRGMIPRPARIPGHDAIALMHDYKTDAIRRDTGCREVAIRQALKNSHPLPNHTERHILQRVTGPIRFPSIPADVRLRPVEGAFGGTDHRMRGIQATVAMRNPAELDLIERLDYAPREARFHGWNGRIAHQQMTFIFGALSW